MSMHGPGGRDECAGTRGVRASPRGFVVARLRSMAASGCGRVRRRTCGAPRLPARHPRASHRSRCDAHPDAFGRGVRCDRARAAAPACERAAGCAQARRHPRASVSPGARERRERPRRGGGGVRRAGGWGRTGRAMRSAGRPSARARAPAGGRGGIAARSGECAGGSGERLGHRAWAPRRGRASAAPGLRGRRAARGRGAHARGRARRRSPRGGRSACADKHRFARVGAGGRAPATAGSPRVRLACWCRRTCGRHRSAAPARRAFATGRPVQSLPHGDLLQALPGRGCGTLRVRRPRRTEIRDARERPP